MPVAAVFPTLLYTARLSPRGPSALDRELRRECGQIREHDAAGRRWSARNYPGGYTSYGSLCQLHRMSSTFEQLERKIRRHVGAFARTLELDLRDRPLAMTDCWINVMGRQAAHGLHLHPLSTISGTYYLRTPRGCPGLKFEDPRLDRYMAAPPRRSDSPAAHRPWITLPARTGTLILFESWLRHEVPPHPGGSERISVSFNYSWF